MAYETFDPITFDTLPGYEFQWFRYQADSDPDLSWKGPPPRSCGNPWNILGAETPERAEVLKRQPPKVRHPSYEDGDLEVAIQIHASAEACYQEFVDLVGADNWEVTIFTGKTKRTIYSHNYCQDHPAPIGTDEIVRDEMLDNKYSLVSDLQTGSILMALGQPFIGYFFRVGDKYVEMVFRAWGDTSLLYTARHGLTVRTDNFDLQAQKVVIFDMATRQFIGQGTQVEKLEEHVSAGRVVQLEGQKTSFIFDAGQPVQVTLN